jgi:hypothetical protein
MSESLQEQIEYGSRCMHGTALGTPGGADLMCGLCESGLTEWVPDPKYGLGFTYGDIDPYSMRQQARHSRVSWWGSDDPSIGWALIWEQVKSLSEVTTSEDKTIVNMLRWQAIKIEDGYWVDPDSKEDQS